MSTPSWESPAHIPTTPLDDERAQQVLKALRVGDGDPVIAACRAIDALQALAQERRAVPRRNVILIAAYDADGQLVVSGSRSSEDPQEDVRVMEAALHGIQTITEKPHGDPTT